MQLLLAEGLAVGALVGGGVHFVGTHQNLVQRTVVLMTAVMGALLDGTFDALVCMTVHKNASFEIGFGYSMAQRQESMQEKVSNVDFYRILW